MLFLLIDPGQKYTQTGTYDSFYPKDIPNTSKKTNTLRVSLMSVSIITKKRSVVIYEVDKLNAKQVAILVGLMYDKHPSVKVAMTCFDERDVSKHIKNMPALRQKKIRAIGVKREANFYEKLTSYIQQRKVPEESLLLPFFKSIGSNKKLNEHNRDLLNKLNGLLFETNSGYIAYAWAGLHKKQKIRPVFKSVFKLEDIKEPKIDPVVKRTRKAKKKNKIEKNRRVGLQNFF